MIIKKNIQLIAINFIIAILLIFIIDFFFPQKKVTSVAHRSILLKTHGSNTDAFFTPNDDYLLSAQNLSKKPFRLRTNSDGFILGLNEFAQDSGAVDIIFYGGSTTECMYVDENKRFPYLVGSKLTQNGITPKILNAGVSGNHSYHSTLNFIALGIPLKPKIVVLMHNINDLSGLMYTGSCWDLPISRTIVQESKVKGHTNDDSSIKEKILNKGRHLKNFIFPNLYRELNLIYQNNKLTNTEVNPPKRIDEWEKYRGRFIPPYDLIEYEFEKSIRSFVNLAKMNNTEVILMTQFNRMNLTDTFIVANAYKQDSLLDFKKVTNYYHRFNEKLREIAKIENILLIDLATEIPSNKEYIYDFVHLNNQGSELVATVIAEKIKLHYSKILSLDNL